MNAIEIQSQADRYVISIDKKAVDKEFLANLLEQLQIEQLAGKVGFDDSILEVGEKINADWWQQNKHRFIKE